MAKLNAEAKVGLLVLVGSVILLVMTFMVGKYEFGEPKGLYAVRASSNRCPGLDEKAAVRMAGVKIGTVERVELVDSHAKVIMRINPDVQIKRGSQAAIKTMGLLGDKFVESCSAASGRADCPQGRQAAERRAEARLSPAGRDDPGDGIAQRCGQADRPAERHSRRHQAGDRFAAPGLRDRARAPGPWRTSLHDLRETTANIKEFSITLRSDGSELVMRLNELVASLNGVVGENRDNLKVTMENVREASKNAELALASIESAARKIDRGEGTLGKLVSDDSMYNNIDSAAKGLSDYVSRVERMQTIIAFRSEYMFPKSKSYFTLELKPQAGPVLYLRDDLRSLRQILPGPMTALSRRAATFVTETYEDKLQVQRRVRQALGQPRAPRWDSSSRRAASAADYLLPSTTGSSSASMHGTSTARSRITRTPI